MHTVESLRGEARDERARAYDLQNEALSHENRADRLDREADELADKHERDLKRQGLDLVSICDRLLAGYLTGAEREIVEWTKEEGKTHPGFAGVCLNHGVTLP